MSLSLDSDYIIVGGGLTGTVLASRLSTYLPDKKVTLIEAGSNEQDNPTILSPLQAHALRDSDFVYKYESVPQKHLNGRQISATVGKMLSGSSAMNAGCWTRCSKADYDVWGKIVGDQRWSYEGQLPYFKKSETWCGQRKGGDEREHGFEGPVKVHSVSETRAYPLKEDVKDAFVNAGLGLEVLEDGQKGECKGVFEWCETWDQGSRQPSGKVYDLSKANVLTGQTAKKIVLEREGEEAVAKGVELLDGTVLRAQKEVIVTAGAFHTPQLLMLSGVGPKAQLEKIGVEAVVPSEEVGQNLHDQISVSFFWKLKHPENGLAMGGPGFMKPEYVLGGPADWMAMAAIDPAIIKPALDKDGDAEDKYGLTTTERPHTEMVFAYAPIGVGIPGLQPPMDGSVITTSVLNLLPTSRGSVTLESSDPTMAPAVDPNYYATAADRAILRSGARNLLKVLNGFKPDVLDGELVAEPFAALTPESTDEEIDRRVEASSSTWYHFGGTAAMGEVVDAGLKVKGVKGLRVADASVLPVPLGGHYQAAMFALAEQAAEMIAKEG